MSSKSDSVSSKESHDWSANQDKQLADFMKGWQDRMGQTYKGTYDGHSINHLGSIYPKHIKEAPLTAYVYDQKQQLTWYHGRRSGRFVIYAVASGGRSRVMPMLHLFALDTTDNSPVVLVSQTTNGQYLWFYETENTELRAGFARILESITADNGAPIRSFSREGETWTKAEAIAYRNHIDSKNAAINAAVGSTEGGEAGYNLEEFTFTSYGRTCILSSEKDDMFWSFTKLSGGRTVIVEQYLNQEPMPAPQVVFYVHDSNHVVYKAYSYGKPLN